MKGKASGAHAGRCARLAVFAAVACTLFGAAEAPNGELDPPPHPRTVVASVPARESPAAARIAALAAAAARAPNLADRAVALARAHVEAARAEGDPRHLGEAEAALVRFVADPHAPAEVRVLEATLLQARHAFPAALRALDRALALRPDDAQALLTQATVRTVLGDYRAARAACARLEGRASLALRVSCSAPLDAREGRYHRAHAALGAALVATSSSSEQALLQSLQGEHAYWHGDLAEAEVALAASLERDPGDRYTRALYADLLLDAGRPAEVAALVQPHLADDALALRGALAAQMLGAHDAAARLARLAQGFDESRLRGDAVHQREEARLLLALPDADAAARALTRARESWAVQREPWDARLVLEAALRASRPAGAQEVRTWLRDTGFEAPGLQTLAARLQTLEAEQTQ